MKHAIFLLVILVMAAEELSAGINVWTSHGPGGGNIQAVAIDPKNPSTLYTAASSQVFKSTDGGANWNSASAGLKASFISALAVDPQNSSTVYALGGGLFKSTDGAQSWNVVNLLPPVSALALDPRNPGTLYAGAAGGVFKSTDGGNSWIPASSGLPGGGVYNLVVDPQNPKTVYAGVGYPGGIFKSTDGGATWNAPLKQKLVELNKSPADTCDNWGYYFSQVMGRDAPAPEDISCLAQDGSRNLLITADQYVADLQTSRRQHTLNFGVLGSFTSTTSLLVDPQNSSALYAATYLGVSKSTDGGVSWSAGETFGLPANNGSGFGVMAVDPKNPGTLYATAYRCDAKGCGLQLYKSMDGAASWNAIGGLPTNSGPGPLAIDPQNSSTLYAGTSSGLFKTTDGAASWSPMNAGLAASSIGALAVDPQDRGTLFAATFCCGAAAVFKSTDAGTSWASIGLPTADSVSAFTVDPQNPATVYAGICCAHQPNDPYPGLFKSMDGGTSWFKTGLAQPPGRLIIDPQNPSTLYAVGGNVGAGILKSTDGGTTWSQANSGLAVAGSNTLSTSFLTIDPQSPNTLYVFASRSSSDSGQIFRTTDGAGSWSAMNLGWDPGLFDLGALVADPQTPGTLYAGTTVLSCDEEVCPFDYWTRLQATSGAGLFKSIDGGNSWVKLDGLDAASAGGVYVLAIDPKNPGTLYAQVYSSVFRSTDGGASWKAVSSGLTAPWINSLAVDAQDPSTVYAATNGGGVFAITFASQ